MTGLKQDGARSHSLYVLQDAVKVMAKSLVRNRRAVTKMYGLKSQLQAVSLRMATLKSTQAMADAMRGATKVCAICPWPLRGPICCSLFQTAHSL